MLMHRVGGGLVVGLLLVASCARTEVQPSSLAPGVSHDIDAGAIADRDHDGVPDDVDRCPEVPEDCDGFEDADGCPDEDNDKDGRPDHCDRCPDIAAQTWNGCPHVILEVETIRIAIGATFEVDGTKPSISADTLTSIVELAKQDRLKRFGIVGHALKTEKNAGTLALRRAAAAKNLLVARGVPGAKIELRVAPHGDLESCPPAGDGGAQSPCASFAAVEFEDRPPMTWDGARYLDPPRPPPPPPLPCPDPPPPGPGRPCR